MVVSSAFQIQTQDCFKYTLGFYVKKERNNFNVWIRKSFGRMNLNVKSIEYKEYLLPVIEEGDKRVKTFDITIEFHNKEDMKRIVKMVRKEYNGYYE